MSQERYTHGHGEAVLRSHRWRTAENSAAYLLAELRPGLALLDVGCGPGTITVDLTRRVEPGQVVGIDASPAIIADNTARRLGADLGVEWQVGDVYRLPFADGEFDVVHAHQVLQHLSDPVAALAEMARVAKPGGLVAARDADYGSMAWYPEEPALDRWLAVYSDVARTNRGEPDAGRRLLAWAHQAGLSDVKASVTAWCYASVDEREWWSALWAERITGPPLSDRAVELGIADPAELQVLADGWRRWGAHPDAWFAVPHGEILCRLPA